MTTTTYFAPEASEYRTLSVFQINEDDHPSVGKVGEWAYYWHGRNEVGGFATEAEARAAGLADGESRHPGLRIADGTENAYGSVKVIDDTAI